jgi:cell division protein FtsB
MDTGERLQAVWQKYGRVILALGVAALLVHNIFGTHGFLAMRRTHQDIEKVKKDIERLSEENARLEEEVKALKTDPKAIEKIARDDLGLAKPGEVIIRIPQGQEPEQKAPQP